MAPRVRDPGQRLVGVDDLPTSPACDAVYGVASRALFVGEPVESRLREAD